MAASVCTFNKRYTPPVGGREFEAGDKTPVKDIAPDHICVDISRAYTVDAN